MLLSSVSGSGSTVKEDGRNDLSPFILLSAKECVDCIKDCVLWCCSILWPIVTSSNLKISLSRVWSF